MGYLISETTKEEREKIVAESLGNIDAACDGCMSGLVEMYQDYIDGKLNSGYYALKNLMESLKISLIRR